MLANINFVGGSKELLCCKGMHSMVQFPQLPVERVLPQMNSAKHKLVAERDISWRWSTPVVRVLNI